MDTLPASAELAQPVRRPPQCPCHQPDLIPRPRRWLHFGEYAPSGDPCFEETTSHGDLARRNGWATSAGFCGREVIGRHITGSLRTWLGKLRRLFVVVG
eukprot:9675772-Heterocapsa_arctica.AAC.1